MPFDPLKYGTPEKTGFDPFKYGTPEEPRTLAERLGLPFAKRVKEGIGGFEEAGGKFLREKVVPDILPTLTGLVKEPIEAGIIGQGIQKAKTASRIVNSLRAGKSLKEIISETSPEEIPLVRELLKIPTPSPLRTLTEIGKGRPVAEAGLEELKRIPIVGTAIETAQQPELWREHPVGMGVRSLQDLLILYGGLRGLRLPRRVTPTPEIALERPSEIVAGEIPRKTFVSEEPILLGRKVPAGKTLEVSAELEPYKTYPPTFPKREYFEPVLIEGQPAVKIKVPRKKGGVRLEQKPSIDGEIVKVGKTNPVYYHFDGENWVNYRTKQIATPKLAKALEDFVRPKKIVTEERLGVPREEIVPPPAGEIVPPTKPVPGEAELKMARKLRAKGVEELPKKKYWGTRDKSGKLIWITTDYIKALEQHKAQGYSPKPLEALTDREYSNAIKTGVQQLKAKGVAEKPAPTTITAYRGVGMDTPVDEGIYGKGEYWTPSEHYAKQYGKVTEAKIVLQKPFIATAQEIDAIGEPARLSAIKEGKNIKEQNELVSISIRKTLEQKGYDGIIVKDGKDIVVFKPDIAKKAPTEVAGVPAEIVKLNKKPKPEQISDFRPGIDKVVRRGNKVFIESAQGEYAPQEVSNAEIVQFKDFKENMGKQHPSAYPDRIEHIKNTPYMSDEGKLERINWLRETIAKAQAPKGEGEIEMHAGIPFGKVIPESVKKFGKKLLYQAQNRVTHPLAKLTVKEISESWAESGRLRGEMTEKLRKSGIGKISDEDAILLTQHRLNPESVPLPDRLKPISVSLDELYNDAFRQASGVGVKVRVQKGVERPIRQVKNYVPRKIKSEIAREMWDDIVKFRREIEKTSKETGELRDEVLSTIADAWYRNSKFNPRVMQGIGYMIKSGQASTPAEAIAMLDDFAFNDLFRPFVNIERPRVIDLPLDFWENDIRKITASYIEGFAKRIPEIKRWGQDGRVITNRLAKITRQGEVKESNTLRDIVRTYTGTIERTESISPEYRAFQKGFTGYQVGTKIGLGTATIPQFTQPTISFIPLSRTVDVIKGGLDLLSKTKRSWARETGATGYDILETMAGIKSQTQGMLGKFADVVTKGSLFQQVNKGLQYWAVSTGRRMIMHLVDLSRSPNKIRRDYAIRTLEKWGIDPTMRPSENMIKEASYRFAMDTQLQRNILKEPLWMNNPRYRWLALFKRFGYKQFNLIKDNVVTEFTKGNPLPLLKLVAGGALGGEFVIWAKNLIRSQLSGRPVYREEDDLLHRVVNDLAAVGTLGWVTDVGRFDEMTPTGMLKDIWRTAVFQVTPVVASDILKTKDIATRYVDYLDRYNFEKANKEILPYITGLVGGVLATQLKERLKSKEDFDQSMNWFKGETKKRATDLCGVGDYEKGFRLIDLWNENNPDYPSDYPDWEDIRSYERRKGLLIGEEEQFYSLKEKVNRVLSSANLISDLNQRREFIQRHPELGLSLLTTGEGDNLLNYTASELNELRKQKEQVKVDKRLTAEQKGTIIQKIDEFTFQLSRDAVQKMNQFLTERR